MARAPILAGTIRGTAGGAPMRRLHLTLAISEYDHIHDLTSGAVPVEGVDLIHLGLSIEEIHFRFTKFREWDVSEMSLAKYVALLSQDDPAMVALQIGRASCRERV